MGVPLVLGPIGGLRERKNTSTICVFGTNSRVLPPTDVEASGGRLLMVAAEAADATTSPLLGHDSGHGISDTFHRSGYAYHYIDPRRGYVSNVSHDLNAE